MTSSLHFPAARSNRLGRGVAYFAIAALLAVTAATAQIAFAQIASGTTGIDATGNAQSERAACLSGKTQQDKATCLTEMKNANAAKRAGQVDNNGGQFSANALKRCDVFQGENRIACQARIAGYGQTGGSVASGGVIREVETVVAPSQPGIVTVQPRTSGDLLVIPAQK